MNKTAMELLGIGDPEIARVLDLEMARQRNKDRVHVILVGEEVGY